MDIKGSLAIIVLHQLNQCVVLEELFDFCERLYRYLDGDFSVLCIDDILIIDLSHCLILHKEPFERGPYYKNPCSPRGETGE